MTSTKENEGAAKPINTRGDLSPLIQALLRYDNKFDTSQKPAVPCVVSVGDTTIYAMRGGEEDLFDIYAVLDSNGENCCQSGSMVIDNESQSVILSYTNIVGEQIDSVHSQQECVEQYLGEELNAVQSTLTPADFILGDTTLAEEEQTAMLNSLNHQQSVRKLCELNALDFEDELATARRHIVVDLYHILDFASAESCIAGRVLKSYDSEKFDTFMEYQVNFESLRGLLNLVYNTSHPLYQRESYEPAIKEDVMAAIRGFRYTVQDYCEFLDSLDFELLALQAISSNIHNAEERLDLYMSLYETPAIGTRLRTLENKMIIAKVLSVLGAGVGILFRRYAPVYKFFCKSTVTSDNYEEFCAHLVSKGFGNLETKVLHITGKLLSYESSPDAGLLKFFILDKNMRGIVETLTENRDRHTVLASSIEDAFHGTLQSFLQLSSTEFHKVFNKPAVYEFYASQRPLLLEEIQRGLLAEASIYGDALYIKALDLFNDLYSVLLPAKEEVVANVFSDNFFNYCGSFAISYCPVVEDAAFEYDGGTLRDLAFVRYTQDFVYDVPLSDLSNYNISDIRNLVPHEF